MARGMTLRLATPADAAALADLGRRALTAKFEHLYRPEDFAQFLGEAHSDAKVASELADPGMRIAVIEQEGALAAFCKLVLHSTLPAGHSDAARPLELKQLYTDPVRIGGGLGRRLMDWALEQAVAAGADEIQLSVYSENPEAQRFYHRYGFSKIADIEFWVGTHCDPEWLYARKVTPADGSHASAAQV
ncbi:MAG: hypothetical protein RIS94_1291 [Pseudomonadota bacterium]|jgi:ribosomal protein S18 acetylase RimI-like enzyme